MVGRGQSGRFFKLYLFRPSAPDGSLAYEVNSGIRDPK